MDSIFFEKSKEIADNFIQSVLFVDDEIYTDKKNTEHNLDAKELLRVFSKAKKLCALNNPRNESDFNDVIEIAKKADISVLDWKMDIPQSEDDEINEEVDVEEDDPRGTFTLRLIQEILLGNETTNTFKLILIYTGEVGLPEIVEKIRSYFEKYDLQKVSDNIIGKKNIKIIIAGKPSLKGRLKHAKDLKDWIIPYDQIPDFLLIEFAKMTQGIISNVALQAMSSIRSNTFKLLSVFNKDLDPAFLAHKALLPNPEDASEQIIEIIGSDIKSLIIGNHTTNVLSNERIDEYVDSRIDNPVNFEIEEKEKFNVVTIPDTLNHDNLKVIIREGVKEYFLNNSDPFEEQKLFENNCHKKLTNCFAKDQLIAKKSNINYAILTSLKSFYNKDYLPILTKGAILKDDKTNGNYWLCIQPKCDSVRIDTVKRAFLFLRLIKVNEDQNFDIAINEDVFLRIDYNIYKSQLIDFKKSDDGTVKISEVADEIRKYKRKDNLLMVWIGELKSNYAQYISNRFAAELSRVGMDLSEWLRRN
jgi:hypothetical protein